MLFDGQGRCLTSNRKGLSLMGCSKDFIIGKKFGEIWPEEVRPAVEKAVSTVLRGRECEFETDRNVLGSKRRALWKINLKPVLGRGGAVKKFVAIAADITNQKKKDSELLQLKKSLESISTGITIADLDGRILYTNPAEARMHGYRRSELIGKHVSIFSPVKSTKRPSAGEIKNFGEWSREGVNVRKDGTVFPVQLKSVYIKDSGGKPVSVITISDDISLRKMAEEELRRYTRELENSTARLIEAHRQLKQANLETILVLTKAAEYRDEETAEHIKRIGLYSMHISERMGFDNAFAELMLHASPMHDVGKIGMPDYILQKADYLSAEEFSIMKQHTIIGHLLLKESTNENLSTASEIAFCHHEKWDGSGYPRRLKGEQIPLTARIVAIADHYDALRSDRPYRKGLPHREAVGIITKGDGRTMPEHFDPAVLGVFEKINPELDEIFMANNTAL